MTSRWDRDWVLERGLPARFGGGPTDYRAVEADGAGGGALRLLVHSRLGDLDPQRVAEAFLAAIGRGPAPSAW